MADTGAADDAVKSADDLGRAVSKADAPAGGWCFVAGTMVLTLAEGVDPQLARRAIESGDDPERWCVRKRIEDVRPGDWVVSRHECNSRAPLTLGTVSIVFAHDTDSLIEVVTADTATGCVGAIHATEEHPFWASTAASAWVWTPAADLRYGHVVSTTRGESRVLGTRFIHSPGVRVYNFTVSKTHTYFVSSDLSAAALWVHNSGGSTFGGKLPQGGRPSL